jgi:hypothetical protein
MDSGRQIKENTFHKKPFCRDHAFFICVAGLVLYISRLSGAMHAGVEAMHAGVEAGYAGITSRCWICSPISVSLADPSLALSPSPSNPYSRRMPRYGGTNTGLLRRTLWRALR